MVVKTNMARSMKLTYTKEDYDLMYWDLCMSSNDIAEVSECCGVTVLKDMKKKGVKIRSLSEANYVKQPKHTNIKISWNKIDEVFDGCMLGDASVLTQYFKTAYFTQACTSHFLSFLEDIKENFNIAGLKINKITPMYSKLGNGFRIRTINHPDLKYQRDRWYPDGIKVIPDDVIVTSKSIAYLFMCDGGKDRVGAGRISTQGYLLDDVKWLCKWIEQWLDVYCYSQKGGIAKDGRQQYRIYIPVSSFPSFVEQIEPYVLPVFKYKLVY